MGRVGVNGMPPKPAPKRAPKRVAPPKRTAPKTSRWLAHVRAYRATHGGSFREALKAASATYRSSTLSPAATALFSVTDEQEDDHRIRYRMSQLKEMKQTVFDFFTLLYKVVPFKNFESQSAVNSFQETDLVNYVDRVYRFIKSQPPPLPLQKKIWWDRAVETVDKAMRNAHDDPDNVNLLMTQITAFKNFVKMFFHQKMLSAAFNSEERSQAVLIGIL